MRERFGELMGKARRNKNITLRKLAELVGDTPSFLSEVELGRRLPPREEERIRNLAIVLNEDEEKFIKVARTERMKKDSKLTEKFFDVDPELAIGLYRAADKVSDDDLEEALRKLLKELEGKETR